MVYTEIMQHTRVPLFRFALTSMVTASFVLMPLIAGADVREGDSSVHISITNTGTRELPPEEATRLRVFIHERPEGEKRPSHRTPLPTCQLTQNDGDTTYALTGWHVPTGGLSYRINAERAPEAIQGSVAAAIQAATQAWSTEDPDKQLTFAGSTEISRPRYDGNNVVLWKLLPRRAVAAAYIWYNPENDEVLDADMVFNTRAPWAVSDPASGDCGGAANAYDVQAVATHEFGHWFGLEDLYSPVTADLTMHGIVTVGELKKASLGQGDRLGATSVAP